MTADEKKIIRSLRSFSGGCCGGIDGLRHAHLLDLVAVSTTEAGLHLRRSITNLTNKILRGDVSDYALNLLFSSNLTALKKKDGGIRPVAVGNVFRCLAAKVGCYAVSCAVSHELLPIQLGVSVNGGAEGAVHAVRTFITNNIDSNDHKVIVRLDMMTHSTQFDATMFYRHAWTARRRLLNSPFSPTENRRQSLLPVIR